MRPSFRFVGVIGLAGALATMLSAPAAATSVVVHTKNSAGYSATSSTGITRFTGSLNVPTITCPATGSPFMSAFVSLGGASSGSIRFTLDVNCSSGSLFLSDAAAFFCLGSTGGICEPEAQVSAAAGDVLNFSLSEDTKTSTSTVEVINSTEKQTSSASAHTLLSEPSIGAETFIAGSKPGNVTPIPSFTPIKFSDLKFNGAILSSFSPTKIEMYDGTTLQVATSSISSAGTFTNTFKHV
jgi:hypothetical protein